MRPKSNKPIYALVRGAWDSTFQERPRFYLFILFFIVAYSLDLVVVGVIGQILEVFVKQGMTPEALHDSLYLIGWYTFLRLASAAFHHTARWLQNRVAYSARMNMMSNVFNGLMDFPLRWHVGHHSGENLSKLHRCAGAIDSMIGTYVWQVIEGLVKVVFAGIALSYLDFWVAANVLVMAMLTVGAMIWFNRPLIIRMRRFNHFNDKLNTICLDYLNNIVTVKILGVEESGKRYLRSQKKDGLRLTQSISAFMELKWGSTGFGNALVISTSLIIYFYGQLGQPAGTFSVAAVYVLLNYLDRIFQAIGSFTGYYSGLIEASTAYEDATDILKAVHEGPDKSLQRRISENWTRLSVKKLNFSYVAGEKVGLNNVKFEYFRGEKIALVGQSGSGKSTLLKVFGGLLYPDGYMLATDQEENVTFDDLGPSVLLIPQEPEIFSETVRYNLTMGEEFDPKEISFFVSLCKLDHLIERLPNGLDSSLAQKGLNLSVGEKQRVALARGLLRAGKKDIILLDEPTSSLDTKNEKEIFLGLLYHFSSRTIISSVHRLNLVPLFDRIVFMSQSQVLEVGTFAELIEARGHFFKVWDDYEQNIKSNSPQMAQASLDVA